jgi:cell wall-associated NlpC family hydrolase
VDDRPTVQTDPSGMCPIDNATPTCMKNWWKWGEKPDVSRLTGKAYRARIVAIVRYTIQHNTAIDYSEDLNGPKERMQGIRAHIRFPHLPRYEDCSSYVDWVYWTAGVPKDPMGNGYDGSPYNNNTGNLSCDGETHTCGSPRYRSHVVTEENAKPGDLVFYFAGGSWPWSHVEIYLGSGIVAGNGIQSDPKSHPIDQHGRHGQIRSYFPELLK